MSVEGTYRGAKILCAGTCDNGYLTNRMAPSKVDEQIKEIFGEFLDYSTTFDDSDNEEEEPHEDQWTGNQLSQ